MTSELQQNRYDQLIRRVGGIIGPGSKVSEALTELFPVIDVERVPGELLLLGGTKIVLASARLAGVAAEIPKIQLFNPADSGVLATVSTIYVSVGSNSLIEFDFVAAAIGTAIGGENVRDTRRGVATRTVIELRTDSSAGGIPGTFIQKVNLREPLRITDRNGVCVLAPGTGVTVDTAETNRELCVSFFWRERTAELSELSF